MKNFTPITIILASSLLLAACGPLIFPTQATMPPAMQTEAAGRAFATLTTIAAESAASASLSPSATLAATLQPSPTPVPISTLLLTIEAGKIPGLLRTTLAVESLEPFQGHSLRRVTGWSNGFDWFDWMDGNHLLLGAITAQTEDQFRGRSAQTFPAVIQLGSGKVWISPSGEDCCLWSAKLGFLIASDKTQGEDRVVIDDVDGNFIRAYPGKWTGTSPSGTKS